MSLDFYWEQLEAERKALARIKPTTAAEVVAILKEYDPQRDGISGDAFSSSANDGGSLAEDLAPAGWWMDWSESDCYYVLRHESTGETLTYIEGDVSAGDQRP